LLKLLKNLAPPKTQNCDKKLCENEIGIGLDACLQPIEDSNLFLIQTTDYFYPLINDPYKMGWIACNNVISDMYAMGCTRIDNVLMLLATSTKFSSVEDETVIPMIMSGFRDCCFAAGTQVRGGQTARNPWVLLGGCATSVLPKEKFIMPTGAKVGDILILTKPLGTQVAVNLHQWADIEKDKLEKLSIKEDQIKKAYDDSTISMMTLNKAAANLMVELNAHCATDVTGFGILGHAQNLAECQNEEVDFIIDTLPCISGTVQSDSELNEMFKLVAGKSAETSGGLLLAIGPENADSFIEKLEKINGHDIWKVGSVVSGSKSAKIATGLKILEISSDENGKLKTL